MTLFFVSGCLKETPAKPLLKQKFNPAVEWNNTTHQYAERRNFLNFNDIYSALSGGLVG